jgi:hypothetical protein
VTTNVRAFRVLVRNALFRHVELLSLRRPDLLAELETGPTAAEWTTALEDYYAEHHLIGTGPDARGPQMLLIDQQPGRWVVRQIVDDPTDDHDWGVSGEVDLAASDEAGVAVLTVRALDRL